MVSLGSKVAWVTGGACAPTLAFALALTLGACVPPLEDEMPCPQCMAKTDFAGVWTYRIEPLDSDSVSEGEKSGRCLGEGASGSVRFEIVENYLFARLLPERPIAGHCPAYGSVECDGPIIGAWEVWHYDNRTDCPERIGESFHIIRENPCEPHWYERRYLRVDWSRNLAMHTEVDRLTGEAVEAEPIHYDATSPDDALFPEIDIKATAGTKRISVSAVGLVRLRSCGDPEAPTAFPECFSIDLGPVSCDPREIRLRQVFEQPGAVQQ